MLANLGEEIGVFKGLRFAFGFCKGSWDVLGIFRGFCKGLLFPVEGGRGQWPVPMLRL